MNKHARIAEGLRQRIAEMEVRQDPREAELLHYTKLNLKVAEKKLGA